MTWVRQSTGGRFRMISGCLSRVTSACLMPAWEREGACLAATYQLPLRPGHGQQALAQHARGFSSFVEDCFGLPPAVPQRRVVVTGLGLVTPLGVGVAAVWERLLSGKSGIRALTEEDLPMAHRPAYAKLQSRVIGVVPEEELQEACAASGGMDSRRNARFMSLALCAAHEALQDADWMDVTEDGKRATGVALGVGLSCTRDVGDAALLIAKGSPNKLSPYFVPKILNNMAAGAVSMRYGFRGPNHAAATACATGAHSIGDAFRLVRGGNADVMLAGGAESCIDAIAIAGFDRLRALSTSFNDDPPSASRPFDAARDGFVLSEGAGVLVMEEMQHAIARGARMYAEVRGYGLSGDAHHITQPDPGGEGARLAMERALHHAGVGRAAVAYVNAHATSTPLGDAVEARAIADVFSPGEENARQKPHDQPAKPSVLGKPFVLPGVPPIIPPHRLTRPAAHPSFPAVSSTKGATGHLLGAAGAVEAIFTILALADHMAPPTLNLAQRDPGDPLGEALVGAGGRALRPGPVAALTNSFGFGGTNASLVFASPPIVLDELVDGEL